MIIFFIELAKKPSKQVFGYDDARPWLPFTPPSGMNSPKKAEEYSRYSARVGVQFLLVLIKCKQVFLL